MSTPPNPVSVPKASDVNLTIHLVPSLPAPAPAFVQDYGFWVNVALSVATLAVTCVAVVVAVLAIVGYQGFKRFARKQSEKHTRTAVAEFLKSDEFKNLIKSVAEEVVQDRIQDKILVVPTGPVLGTPRHQADTELS